jgi:hypothetical protein
LELNVQIVADEVKEGLEIGVAGVLGELCTVLLRLVKEEGTSSVDMEARSWSGKWSLNLAKSEPVTQR